MRFSTLFSSGLLVMLGAVGCKNANEPPEPGPPVVTTLSCRQPNGTLTGCTLVLPVDGNFRLTLVSEDCDAHGNTARVTAPAAAATTLTTDGCYETVGTVWTLAGGPYEAGTELAFEIKAPSFPNPASLVATGTTSPWTLRFEDGADDDQNDLVFRVEAIS